MTTFKNYLSLVKFSHTIFAMPFAMIGYFTAVLRTGHGFSWFTFLLVIACMVFARSAAMAFNRWLDAHFDALNPRTALREIPAGIISRSSALWFVIVCCLLFIGSTALINRLCLFLSPVALFVVLFYSYTKRFTALCHLVLGVGLSLAPIGAYLAVTGTFALLPVLFSFAVVFWVSGFDVIYALQDESFDKEQHLHSMPAAVGIRRALRISELLHVLSAASVIAAGVYGHFGVCYWIGVAVFVGMLIMQHRLVKPGDLSRVNLAFMTTNGIASVVFSVFVVADMFLFKGPL
ncbi:UbiA-like polyprenyltransferase [Dinghuibacter silviterrae]|uniref:4-hydroxybenzoate polyprenyltransferase n=1 Tax=Dinghuibacter silviterrae TaxID=1539049 RepID=A0A4R8DFW4_9BACT|nr:UbiA-like polyprenyltransferase [Dinghuibacter silviterrae]TDW96501.1 4-hydroxybenzoate polyprenyltransferase [Dinghuibacter silviterrae]